MTRRALGRGLEALISPIEHPAPRLASSGSSGLTEIELALIEAGEKQPRQVFDETKLHELAESLREQGLVQPVIVRKRSDGRFELIAGERRVRAARLLEWKTIPAVIKEATDAQVLEWALVENLQREDLNPLEMAEAYTSLRKELGLTHEQIATRLGISRSRVTNTMRLLELPQEVKDLLRTGELTEGHARALLALPDAVSQIRLAKRVAKEGLTVRAVERLVMQLRTKSPRRPVEKDLHVRDAEERLRQHLGAKVTIQPRGTRGTIAIEYQSYEDFARILEAMGIRSQE